MARITKEAKKHAARRALARGAPLEGLLDDDDELGSVLGSLGRIAGGAAGTVVGGPVGTAIGSGLGGAVGDVLGGGGGSSSSGKPKPTPAAPAMVMSPSPEQTGPSREEIRGIVQDALARSEAERLRTESVASEFRQTAREMVDQVRAALEPTARQTRGSIQEQRLQTQATQEHRAIQRRDAQERTQTERYNSTAALLGRILDSVGKVQQKLSGRVAVVRGKDIDVLGGDSLVKTR
jgi:hypothetical protein